MNNIIKEQLKLLTKNLEYQVDDVESNTLPDSFSNITFKKNTSQTSECLDRMVVFQDYIVHPYDGFDFHTKFNNDVPPPENVMYGYIEKETEKMYFFNLTSSDKTKHWRGWCPRKSCSVEIK